MYYRFPRILYVHIYIFTCVLYNTYQGSSEASYMTAVCERKPAFPVVPGATPASFALALQGRR